MTLLIMRVNDRQQIKITKKLQLKPENCERGSRGKTENARRMGRRKHLLPIPLADFSKIMLIFSVLVFFFLLQQIDVLILISTGIKVPYSCGKQAASINDGRSEHVTEEPALPQIQGTPMKQITLLGTTQVNMPVACPQRKLTAIPEKYYVSHIIRFRRFSSGL